MIECSYCKKQLDDRKVFCNSSHKVMYHRKGKGLTNSKSQAVKKEDIPMVNKEEPVTKKKTKRVFSKIAGAWIEV